MIFFSPAPDSAKHQQAENEVLGEVRALANHEMDWSRVLIGMCGSSQCSTGIMMQLVFSEVKAPVENVEISSAHTSAGHHYFSQRILLNPFLCLEIFLSSARSHHSSR